MRFTGAFLVASNCSSHLLCPPHRPFSRDGINPALNTRSASVVLGWHLPPYWPQAAQGCSGRNLCASCCSALQHNSGDVVFILPTPQG